MKTTNQKTNKTQRTNTNPSKKKEADIIKSSVPEVFGDKKTEVYNNYVYFPVPLHVFRKIRAWLDQGDTEFMLATGCRSKLHPYENLKLCIVNVKEQKIYETGKH